MNDDITYQQDMHMTEGEVATIIRRAWKSDEHETNIDDATTSRVFDDARGHGFTITRTTTGEAFDIIVRAH